MRALFYLIFAVSGFAGLIYESIWTHYLKLFLGHAAYAQTLTLAIFMGGMAAGAWVAAKYSFQWRRLLLGYAVVEGLIGIGGLVFHHVYQITVHEAFTAIIPFLGAPWRVTLFKWTLAAELIAPQSFLLGMTFPLMSAGFIRKFPDAPGSSISMLYFANSIGAAIGVLVSGFYLIEKGGLPGALLVAGILNILVALSAWALSSDEQMGETPREGSASRSASLYKFFLIASFVTGAASFIYEIGWIRMLSLVLGSSTHAFEIMLSAFISGIALGGLWIRMRIEKSPDPAGPLARVQIAMGLLALMTIPVYGRTFDIMGFILHRLVRNENGYMLFNLSSHGIALLVMLPATFCAGMTLPLITYSLLRRGHGEKSIGAVYAANTLGAILGVFAAVHILMPALGLKGLIATGAALDVGLGIAIMWTLRERPVKMALTTAAAVCAFGGIILFAAPDPLKMASGVYREGEILPASMAEVVFHRDGKTASVDLVKYTSGDLSLRTNGKADASINFAKPPTPTPDEITQSLVAAIPLSVHPSAKTVANIGLGSGLTASVFLLSDTVSEVDTVEIEPAMLEAAKRFRPRVDAVFNDPRSRIFIEDARTFFSTRGKKYDIIVSEPSNPWVSGIAGLFTTEFYCAVAKYLNSGGVFVQWVQAYEIDTSLVASIVKALAGNFADFDIYASSDNEVIIVAGKDGALPSPGNSLFNIPAFATELSQLNVRSADDIEIRKIGGKKTLAPFFHTFTTPPNSDYFPVLDLNAVKARFMKAGAQEFLENLISILPAMEMMGGTRQPRADWDISPSQFFYKSRAERTAKAVVGHMIYGKEPEYPDALPKIMEVARRVREFYTTCPGQTDNKKLLDDVYTIAIATTSYLSAEEMNRIWRYIENSECFPRQDESIKKWIHLFHAVGVRDARAMISMSESMLRENAAGDNKNLAGYALASGMLGHIAIGDRAGSRQLYKEYWPKIFGSGTPRGIIHLLAANS